MTVKLISFLNKIIRAEALYSLLISQKES